ncbi:formin-like protein 5 [Trichechus manatus latirostris]|uniref:Formin-like protein 5 n=1 Tax=Trichechus manatus latirostris TaxID=127582 RepID=A0A2Y9FW52_TRIMA|nr:formin-like protein 5 [Trichechus manatus latirostris]
MVKSTSRTRSPRIFRKDLEQPRANNYSQEGRSAPSQQGSSHPTETQGGADVGAATTSQIQQRAFPSPASLAKEAETRGEGRPRGVAWPLRTASPANRIPRRRRNSDFTPPSLPRPESTRGRPPTRPPPQQARARPPARGPAHLRRTGGGLRQTALSARPAPPLPPQSHARAGPAPERRRESPPPPRAPGLRSPPPPAPRATPLRPPPPLTHPHTSRPPSLREAGEVSPPKNTHPRVRRYPPPKLSPHPRPLASVLSPQSCFSRSSLCVPLSVSLGLSREALRTARGAGPPKRTGSLLSTKKRPQTPREDSTSSRHRPQHPPVKDSANRYAPSADSPPLPTGPTSRLPPPPVIALEGGYPGLSHRPKKRGGCVSNWQATGNLFLGPPTLSSLLNPAETARNERWQQVGLTPRMVQSREATAANCELHKTGCRKSSQLDKENHIEPKPEVDCLCRRRPARPLQFAPASRLAACRRPPSRLTGALLAPLPDR